MSTDTIKQKKILPVWILNSHYKNYKLDLVNKIITLINTSQSIIVLSSFFLADNTIEKALIMATKRNVRCYIMIASEIRIRQEIKNKFDQKAYDQHISMLKNLSGITLIRSSEKFHAKIIIIDPNDDPYGLLLTANLTFEALNRNQELAVELNPVEINDAMNILKWAFWEYSEHESLDKSHILRDCKPLGEIQEPIESTHILQTTPNCHSIQDKIIDLLDGNPNKVIIASYGWDKDHHIVKKLCELSKQGKEIVVLTRPRSISMNVIIKMKENDIRVLGFNWFHAKAVITDSQGIVMSSNIQKNGLEVGFELGIYLDGNRLESIKIILNDWIKTHQYELFMTELPNDKMCKWWDGTKLNESNHNLK